MLGMTVKKMNEISANLSVNDLIVTVRRYYTLRPDAVSVFDKVLTEEGLDEMCNDMADLGIRYGRNGRGVVQVMCYDGILHVGANWSKPMVHAYPKRRAEKRHAKYVAAIA